MDIDRKLEVQFQQPANETNQFSLSPKKDRRNIKVMMIGPGSGIIGGISTLVDMILPAINNEVILYYFPTVSNRPSKDSGKFSWQNFKIAAEQFGRFAKAIHRFHPQILHIHTSQGLAWLKDTLYIHFGKQVHCKVIIHLHAAEFDELYSNQSALIKRYTRWALSRADAVIAVSEIWRERLEEIVEVSKIHTFKNCIKVEPVDFAARPQEDSINVLFLGSIGPRKGAFDLIEAAAKIKTQDKPVHIWLAGYEERPGDLEIAKKQIAELHMEERCDLVGVIKGEKKLEYLQNMDFFVLPSHNEGLPMAILEAMQAGKAVISCPVGGISEIVREGENGFLVTPGDIDKLAEKIDFLIQHPDVRKRMGEKSLQIIQEELTVTSYVDRLVHLYEDLLNEK